MGCCGSKRRESSRGGPRQTAQKSRPGLSTERAGPPRQRRVAYFEYVGTTGLSVIGPVTGRHYRFDGTGVVIAVDVRDEPYLPAVPHLRKLAAGGA